MRVYREWTVTGEAVVSESAMASLFASSARRGREAMADPLASERNEAIGGKSKPDTIDFRVTVH